MVFFFFVICISVSVMHFLSENPIRYIFHSTGYEHFHLFIYFNFSIFIYVSL